MSAPVDQKGPGIGTSTPLDALLVEDSATDASLIERELQRSGFEAATERVDTRDAVLAALTEGSWDVVLCDHMLPGMDSTWVLETLAELENDVPMIVVSGTIGEAAAVAALQHGAADYVDKDHLDRLGPAVRHTLHTADARRAQRLAEEEATRLALIVESSHDAIISMTLDGVILSWNPGAQRLYGYGADEAEGRHLSLLASPGGEDEMSELLERVGKGERIEQFETVRLTKERRLIDISRTISPIMDHDGNVVGAATIDHDVTERNEARKKQRALEREQAATKRLRELDRLKDEFLSTVSHELRTPITAISALAEVLSGPTVTDREDRADLLERILQNSSQMGGMIEELLDFSRLQAGKVSVEIRPLALREAALRCIDLARSAIGTRRISLEIPDDLRVRADERAFERILGNLLTNAANFSAEDSTIRVTARAKNGEATIAVEDEGIGIAPADQAQVFERFFQATTLPGYRGTGLGLSIVRRYVELLGGRVRVESKPGQGSTFILTLPLSMGPNEEQG